MTQQEINHKNEQEIHAPFHIKSAGVSLVAVIAISLYYFANVISLLPGEGGIPDGAIGLAINSVILTVVVVSVLQIVLFIGAGKIENLTAKDQTVSALSRRNAYVVLSVGGMITVGSMFYGFTPFEMANLLLLFFVIAEVIRLGSEIFYYQR